VAALEAMTKWTEKRDEIVKLIEAASVPKLKGGDYTGVI
jgi:hypothetical protein